jgi:phospholipid/cholesterol/gamma-HCH transport system ATP-binding protein
MIRIRSLNKSFKGQRVFADLDLDVPEGKVTVIIGPSGTGKSVLMKHILGLIKPDSGDISVNGRKITAMREIELGEVRKEFGVCFQDAALFDSMNVGENVGFPYTIYTKLSREKIRLEVARLLRDVGLSGIEEKMPSQLSGGMRKRVGLARALAMNPKYILFDEPTSGLDPIISRAINMLICDVQEKTGATCLVISHDIQGALEMADYMAMLYQGRIVFEGAPEKFRSTDDPLITQYLNGGVEGPISPIE